MFVVTNKYTFTRSVKVHLPTPGGSETQEFKATFRMMPAEEQDTFDLNTTSGTTGFLNGIVVNFGDLVDEQNQAVTYSEDVRDQLLQFQIVRLALTKAYFGALSEAPEGN